MRQIIRAKLDTHPELKVVGEAADAIEARSKIKLLNPDVITLDIEMPRMNGLEFLKRIMTLRPMPVVMVSSLTQASTDATVKALQLGAIDCVAKPTDGGNENALDGLAAVVLAAAKTRPGKVASPALSSTGAASTAPYNPGNKIIMIGSSTGGVDAVFQVLQSFPANCPPTLITQHIPAHFSRSFAERLDKNCSPDVVEAHDGLRLRPGLVAIAPGSDAHLELAIRPVPMCKLKSGDKRSGHRPSVDVLFESGIKHADRISAAILTGMGQDGAEGLYQLHQAGAQTFAQDEATSVVYGMPRAAFERGAVRRTTPLDRIASSLL